MGVINYIRSFTLASSFTSVIAQSFKALTTILSVCNLPAAINPTQLSNVLLHNNSQIVIPNTPLVHSEANLEDMFAQCSSGKAKFSTDIYPEIVNVPCHLDLHSSCVYQQWSDYADNYIETIHKVQVYNYKYHIYVLPAGICEFGGQGMIPPCYPYCKVWIEGSVAYEITPYLHELLHNVGLHHAGYLRDEYRDLSDTMGYCCNIRCLNAPHSYSLNWSKPKAKLIVKHIEAFKQDITLSDNEYVIIDEVMPLHTNILFVQYRKQDLLYDNEIPYPFSNCINIYQINKSKKGYTQLRGILCKEWKIWKSEGSKLIITILSISKNHASIEINNILHA
jgi:hypothetical protein